MKHIASLMAACLAALLLASCGGGTTAPASPQAPQTAGVAAQAPQAASALTATVLMDWAEANYPALFTPAGQANQVSAPYTYRYYAGTGNYLGVDGENIYLKGPAAGGGNAVQYVGSFNDFSCRVLPSTCTSTTANTSATAVTTSGVLCSFSQSLTNAFLNMVSTAAINCSGTSRVITGNGIPDHTPGTFPSSANPNTISAQNVRFTSTTSPAVVAPTGTAVAHILGYANNSIKFDPSTAESYQNAGVWNIEALNQTYFSAGADSSNAHVQPNGAYHYHGMPEGYITRLNKGTAMTLVGWAVDGFPVYARYGYNSALNAGSGVKVVASSWRLKATASSGRPSTSLVAMGTFTQDFEYVAGLGDLDECNGRFGVTPEFPNGIYHYYITSGFPYIQRCVKGTAASTTG